VEGLLLPVGEGWLAAWRRNGSLQLYDRDGLHASKTGTYLAALVIWGALSERSCAGLPSTLRTEGGEEIEIAPDLARLLQEAADEANRRPAGR
jgi:hypothetical protein